MLLKSWLTEFSRSGTVCHINFSYWKLLWASFHLPSFHLPSFQWIAVDGLSYILIMSLQCIYMVSLSTPLLWDRSVSIEFATQAFKWIVSFYVKTIKSILYRKMIPRSQTNLLFITRGTNNFTTWSYLFQKCKVVGTVIDVFLSEQTPKLVTIVIKEVTALRK